MVGVRTSNRCENCRIRKKKCDEKRPACTGCLSAGWKCPGYSTTKPWKFVDEAPKLEEAYAGRKFVYDTIASSSSNTSSSSPSAPDDGDGDRGGDGYEEAERLNGMVTVWKHQQKSSNLPIPRYREANPLGMALIYCLDCRVKGCLVPLRKSGSFWDFIPARIGHNAALDDAVACISAIYRSAPAISYHANRAVYETYVKALASLRGCLSEPSLRMRAETLCASICLHMCEVVVSTGKGDWGNLAQGTSLLLSSRGVQGYSSEFEYAMLESQMPYVFGQSFRLREPCFLSSAEWQNLLSRSPVWSYQAKQPLSLTLRTRLITYLSDAPNLMNYYASTSEDEMYQPERREQTDVFIAKASAIFDSVKRFLVLEAEPHFLSYSSSPQGLQEHINYPDLLWGVCDCVANTVLVTVDGILRSLCHARLVSKILMGESFADNDCFDAPEIVEGWRQRAVSAFEWVENESKFSARLLSFGIDHIRAGARKVAVGPPRSYPVALQCLMEDCSATSLNREVE